MRFGKDHSFFAFEGVLGMGKGMSQPLHKETHSDQTFGQAAVALGYVADAQVQECLRIQAAMRQMGLDEQLGDIMTKKGYLTPQYHSNVLKKLGVQSSPIPGYAIQGKIGQGGMGIVYKATQTSVNRVVAIKILSGHATKDKTFVARFLQEAQSAANLNHPNIVGIYDWGQEDGTYFIVMEYVEGRSLRDLIRSEGLIDPGRAADITAEIASALAFAHRSGHVGADLGRAPRGDGAVLADHLAQGAPLDVLHDDEVRALLLAPVVDGDDVGVVEVGGRARLPAEALDERPVGRELGKEDLERDRTIQEEVSREEDLRHSAPGKVLHDLIPTVVNTQRHGQPRLGGA